MFENRKEAGQKLAYKLKEKLDIQNKKDFVILALPRGGVIVAQQVSEILGIPFDVIVTRKIGHPFNPEYAIGAVGESGCFIANPEVAESEISQTYLKKKIQEEQKEIQRRLRQYRPARKFPQITDKKVILIDDGIATGLTVMAAIAEIKRRHPFRVILALPVAAPEAIRKIKKEFSEVIVLEQPRFFSAVSQCYRHFEQVTDKEVREAMKAQDRRDGESSQN